MQKSRNKENLRVRGLDLKNRRMVDSWIADITNDQIKESAQEDEEADQLTFSQDETANVQPLVNLRKRKLYARNHTFGNLKELQPHIEEQIEVDGEEA